MDLFKAFRQQHGKQHGTLLDEFVKKQKEFILSVEYGPDYQSQRQLYDDLEGSMCADGVDADELPNATGHFGLSTTNPIPCKMVFGSTSYLARLKASDGMKIKYSRIGSFNSSVSPHPVDAYEITHPSGQKLPTLYISPYQKRNSTKAPLGFILAEYKWLSAYKYGDIFIGVLENMGNKAGK
jgi:hypothetical protein